MKRLLALALLALPAWGQVKVTTAPCKMTDGSCGAPTYTSMTAPTGCASGLVPYFNSSLQLVCSPTVYAPATDTTTAAGAIAAKNLTASGLATPGAITVTPALTMVGSITTVAGSALVDGDGFVIKYTPAGTVPLEFDLSPGNGTTGGAIPILFTAGDSADLIRDNIILALNAAAPAALTASSGGAATVALTLDVAGVTGGTNTEAVANAGFAVTGFANPPAATTVTYQLVACLASGECTQAGVDSTTGGSTATLGAANSLRLSWSAVTGAASYKVYRKVAPTSPATVGIVYTGTALTVDDVGLVGDTTTASAVDGTGRLTSDALTSGRVAIVGAGGRVEDDSGLTYDPATDTLTSGTLLGKVPGVGGTIKVCASNAKYTAGCDFICDGTADNVEIQAAIAALPATGGSVVLSDGNFNIAATVYSRYGLALSGAGRGATTLTAITGITDAVLQIESSVARGTTAGNDVTVSDLAILQGAFASVSGIYVRGNAHLAKNTNISRVRIVGSGNSAYGVLTTYAVDFHVSDSWIDWTPGDSCIETRSTSRTRITGNTLIGATFQIYADAYTRDVLISGNTLYDSDIRMTNNAGIIDGLVITGNSWTLPPAAANTKGWNIRYAKNVEITNNVIDGTGSTTMTAPLISIEATATEWDFSHNQVKTGTHVANARAYGAILAQGIGGRIADNTLVVPGDYNYGVATTTATAGPLLVSGNRIIGNDAASATALSFANAAGVEITGNWISDFPVGVTIAATTTGARLWSDNRYASCTANVSDAGTSPEARNVIVDRLSLGADTGTYAGLVRSTYYVKAVLGDGSAGGGFMANSYRDLSDTMRVEATYGLRLGSAGKVLYGPNAGVGSEDAGIVRDGVGALRASNASTGGATWSAAQYKLTALNTAPANATVACTTGEIRIAADFIYLCSATDTWVRTALVTWP